MGSFSFRADSLTGEATSSSPRPFGRSGWVTTRYTRNPAPTSLSSVGTAKRGVPQKTRSRGIGKLGNLVIEKLKTGGAPFRIFVFSITKLLNSLMLYHSPAFISL